MPHATIVEALMRKVSIFGSFRQQAKSIMLVYMSLSAAQPTGTKAVTPPFQSLTLLLSRRKTDLGAIQATQS